MIFSDPFACPLRRAAHVLWQLAANNPGAPVRIVNAGAISPLVALLGTGSIEAKEEVRSPAVHALSCPSTPPHMRALCPTTPAPIKLTRPPLTHGGRGSFPGHTGPPTTLEKCAAPACPC